MGELEIARDCFIADIYNKLDPNFITVGALRRVGDFYLQQNFGNLNRLNRDLVMEEVVKYHRRFDD